MKKIALFLVLAVLLPVFAVGCANQEETPKDSYQADVSTGGDGKDANGYILDDLPETMDFGGQAIDILHWQEAVVPEFEVEGLDGDIVSNAVHKRNNAVEERLKVDLVFHSELGNAQALTSYVTKARADAMSTGDYDIYACYSMAAANLAADGITQDLLDTEGAGKYINFDKPWWTDSIVEGCSVNDNLYFCSGDISTNLLGYMFVVYFNKDMASQLGVENLYDAVSDGSWTLEKMKNVTLNTYSDVNGNGKDIEDTFGMVANFAWIDGFFYGSELTTIKKDGNGMLIRSENWGGEKTQTLLTKICDYFYTFDGWLVTDAAQRDLFSKGKSLLVLESALQSMYRWSQEAVNFGVLPYPKYDEEQQNYYTIPGMTYTLYCVSTVAGNTDACSAVLEAMASQSYRAVTPEIFERAFKYRYAPEGDLGDNIPMWELIRDSITFDLGRIFAKQIGSLTYSMFRNAVKDNTPGEWSSTFAGSKDTIDEYLTDIMLKFS